MDYVWQMEQVANEMNVPFIDLTTATADLYLSYGDSDCHSILSDGDGSTHLCAVGAALIARRFAGLCREAGVMSEHIRLTSDLSVSPSAADLGRGYVGQTLTKELMVTAFDLTPAAGQLTVTAEGNAEVSTDLTEWSKSASVSYEGGTIIRRFSVRMTLESDNNDAKIIVSAGGKSTEIPVTASAVQLSGGTEVTAYWRLEKDDSYTLSGPATVIPESWVGMTLQKYSNPNANTVWPEGTGFEASRKTQRNVIQGDSWPAGEIDEVSTRYIEFGITAMPETTLNIDEISYYMCGCGGNGMCVHVYYSTEDDFSDTKLIYEKKSMPANTMLDGTVRPIISLEGGKSLRLRFYPWYNSAATGKTICLSDIRFHGWATASGESGIAEIEGDRTIVETSYYTLQGCRVSNPSSGFYIARSLYSDGSVKTEKVIL